MRKRLLDTIALVCLLAAVASLAGCIQIGGDDVPEWLPEWMLPKATPTETASPDPASGASSDPSPGVDRFGRPMPQGTHGHGEEILLMGRSVMGGWFDHWGWNGDEPVIMSGFALYYGELDTPPDVADRAVEYIRTVPDTTIVGFKLCFVDFWARSADDVEINLAENLGYVEQVVDAARERGVRLILMTALPETSTNTNAALLDLHRRYDAALSDIAAANDDVYLLDVNDVLIDQTGALSRGLATSPSDAHPNEVGYLELDDELFGLLQDHFAR